MELITDNFSRRLRYRETFTCFRRDSAFTIAASFGGAVKISNVAISVCVACMSDYQIAFR
jgi:hypothetical protein